MATKEADFIRQLGETQRRFVRTYSALPMPARVHALKGARARTADPLEKVLADQAIRRYEAEGRLLKLKAEHARLDAMDGQRAGNVERNPHVHSIDRHGRMQELEAEAEAEHARLESLAGEAGLGELRRAQAAALTFYKDQAARSEEVAQAREIAEANAAGNGVTALAAKLEPAARARRGLAATPPGDTPTRAAAPAGTAPVVSTRFGGSAD